jgi:parallel beta-helix repeat protein
MKIIAQSLISIFLALSIQVAQAWVSVGSSPGFGSCDYSSIQAAIDSNETEIRVLNNQVFTENLIIDQSIDIRGGFNSCLAASVDVDSSNNTVISGSGLLGSAVIEIDSTTNPVINLHKLTLQDAVDTTFVTNGGHGLDIGSSNGFIQLFDTVISDNSGEEGGGIYVGNTSGDLTLILHDSTVETNVASGRGGGIFCAGTDTLIRISGDSVVAWNEAVDGGGIAALNGCILTVDAGSESLGTRGIVNNSASNNGGGIYLNSAAHISLEGNKYGLGVLGNNTDPVSVFGNTADSNGAGIYAINSSSIDVVDGYISANHVFNANGDGGGVYLGASSGSQPVVFNMTSSSTSCWRPGECSILAYNSADLGGAVYSVDGAQVTIENTHVRFNRANWGTAFYIHNSGSFDLTGSYVYGNGGDDLVWTNNYVIRAFGPVDVSLIHNTIVDNDFISTNYAVIGIYDSTLSLKNSIVRNSGTTLFNDSNSSVSTDFSCLILSENSSLPGTVIDSEFVDSSNQNYHLSANSQAMDFCSDEGISMLDADGDTRGWDDPTINNSPGMTFDPGADESYVNDIIFKHSFE